MTSRSNSPLLLCTLFAILAFCTNALSPPNNLNETATNDVQRRISCPFKNVRLPMQDCDTAILGFPQDVDPFTLSKNSPVFAFGEGRCAVNIALLGDKEQRTSWPLLYSSLLHYKTSCSLSNLDVKPGEIRVGPDAQISILFYQVAPRNGFSEDGTSGGTDAGAVSNTDDRLRKNITTY